MDPAAVHLQAFLSELGFGDDPEMVDTAQRFTAFLRPWATEDPLPQVTPCAITSSGPVVLRDMPFYSLCAHHLLPFHGAVSVAYQPADAVAGLGSVPRLLAHLAGRPQLQERLADELADALAAQLDPAGLAVVISARHMCVEMRGARTTLQAEVSALRGASGAQMIELLRTRA